MRKKCLAPQERRSLRLDHHAETKDRGPRQRTRSQSLQVPTQLATLPFSLTVREMLAAKIDGTAFRLIGAGVSALKARCGRR